MKEQLAQMGDLILWLFGAIFVVVLAAVLLFVVIAVIYVIWRILTKPIKDW